MNTSTCRWLSNSRAKSLFAALILLHGVGVAALAQRNTLQLRRWPGTQGAMLTARSNGCSVLLPDGRVLITGGVSDNGSLSSAEYYEKSGKFAPAPSMSVARADHACSLLPDGNVLVAGGRNAGGVTNASELFDTSAGEWRAGPAMPWSRAGASFVSLNDGRLLLAGGMVGVGISNDVVLFDPASLTFQPASARLASPRRDHAMAVLKDGRVVIGGGFDGERFLDSVEVFDPATGMIARAGRLSAPRSGLTATTMLDGRVVFIGGGGSRGEYPGADIYDPKTGAMDVELAMMTQPRRNHAALRLPNNNTILLIGGTAVGDAIAQIEAYVPWKHSFQSSGTLDEGRTAATVSSLGKRGAALIAGGTTASHAMSAANVTCVPTVETDSADYAPGTTVIITGSCWLPGGTVQISLTQVPDNFAENPIALAPTVVAADGTFTNTTFAPDINDVGVTFYLTATESVDGDGNPILPALTAQTSFTDGITIESFTVQNSSCSGAAITTATYGATICGNANVSLTGGSAYRVQWYSSATISAGTLVYDDAGVSSPPSFLSSHVINSLGASGVWTILVCKTGNQGSCSNGNQSNNTTITILKKPLVVTGILANNRPYDATTTATLNTTAATLSGVVAGDTVTLTTAGATGQFSDASAGTDKLVTISGLSLGGSAAGKYTLIQPTATASITTRGITGSFTVANKVYDGTTTATANSRSLSGVLGVDSVSLTGGTAEFADKNAGTGKTVTLAGATLTGTDAGNYSLTTVGSTTANVSQLHVTGNFTAANKTYDSTASATVVTRSLPGAIAADAVNLTGGTATFNNKTVATGKPVTLTGGTLAGIDAVNYVLDSVATAAADITALQITGSFTASNKTYDGNNSAGILTRSLTGTFAGDTVTLTGGTATFDDKTAGNSKTVTLAGAGLAGTDAVNYMLGSVSAATANIDARHITGTFTASNKQYDGNATATVLTRSLTGTIGSDAVTLSGGTAAFADKTAATGKSVMLSGATLNGADSANYVLDSVATASANITALHLTGDFTAQNKVYDGNNSATVLTRSLPGAVGGDAVSLTGGTATFSDKTAAIGKTVTLTGAGLSGSDAANYVLDLVALATADVTPLHVSGAFTASNKVYDGNNSATVVTRSVTGVLGGDILTLIAGTATFNSKMVADGKTVTLTSASLTGTDAANYFLEAITTTSANITPLHITGTFTAASKTYDGNTSASVMTRSLLGAISGDLVAMTGGTAAFSDKSVSSGKTVTLNGTALAGADALNYVLDSVATTTANISELHLTGSFTAGNKVYDGNNAATVLTRSLPGLIAGDAVNVTGGIATFNDKSVGIGKVVTLAGANLSGADAANYVLDSITAATANITALPISGAFTAGNKQYDGTTTAAVLTRSLSGTFGGDTVTLTGGTATFADKAVGVAKTVTLTGGTLTGPDAGNYTLNSVTTTTAIITALHITGTFTAANKQYDGNTSAGVLTRSLAGVIENDAVSLTGATATFSDKYVANGKTVTLPGAGLAGADALNYVLDSVSTTTANITPLHLTGSFTADHKVYDGTVAATVLTRSLPGSVAGDAVNVTGGIATFYDKSVGIGKMVTLAGASLSGADAANYVLDSITAATANITALPISGAFTVDNKQYDGNTTAAVLTRSLNGLLGGDTVAFAGGTATFADKTVGVAKTVTLTGGTLTGPHAGNYALNSVTTSTASITALHITGSFTAANKQYDGNTSASVLTRSLANPIQGDTVSLTGGTATFSDKAVANGKPVTLSGAGLAGSDALNYVLDSVGIATANITPAHVAGSFIAANKAYDGTTAAAVVTRSLPGAIAGDVVALIGGTATFADSAAAIAKPVTLTGGSLSGADAGNYILDSVAASAANITPLSISGAFTAASKVYDGTTAATVLTRSLSGVLGGDAVSLTGGTALFSNRNAGPSKPVALSGATLFGSSAANYSLTSVGAATANITSAPLTITAVPCTKTYDGTTSAPGCTPDVTGLRTGDSVTGLTEVYDTKFAGTGKTLTVSSLAVNDGNGGGNYSVATLPNTAGVITNFAPGVTITGPASGLVSPAGTPISFTGTFTDNPGDTHTAVWTVRDSSGNAPISITGIVTDAPSGGGTVTASSSFANISGVFSIKLTVTDINGLSATTDVVGGPAGMPAMVVIYDPTAGFVTGGGWITSSAGAYIPNLALSGKASFGFVSKYAKGQTVPAGQTQFTFSVGNLNFHSTSYQWLIVSGPMAQYNGKGTINGSGTYGFLLTARDGSKAGVDGFRIKITDGAGAVVYDNMLSADDSNSTNNVQTLGGGSIQIHN